MKILLIGNGFDLEHRLPTTYKNFLDFCEKVKDIYSQPFTNESARLNIYKTSLDNWIVDDYIKDQLLNAFKSRSSIRCTNRPRHLKIVTSNEILNELYPFIETNAWLEYFFKQHSYLDAAQKINWIDFESEISQVIQALSSIRSKIKNKNNSAITSNEVSIIKSICNTSPFSINELEDINKLDKFINFLDGDLEALIRALEIYIAAFVHNIDITHISSDIKDLAIDRVLSFNYSDTYERVYGTDKKIIYDYIHGKADITKNIKTCNLVLGIDEFLPDNQKDEELDCLSFKKYYQRIYKSTDNAYLDWADNIREEYNNYLKSFDLSRNRIADPISYPPKLYHVKTGPSTITYPQHTLYVFGHSLDVTDKDILKLFICNNNVQTKIFYPRKNENDKTALGKLIKNLVRIIGQDELIRRTGGTHKTIEFIPQTLSQN